MITKEAPASKKYLLILPCSKQKKQLSNAIAINLYDGPFFRIVRKYNLKNIDVLILSAKYGLIRSDKLISNYNQKMTAKRAKEISKETKSRLETMTLNNNYDQIFINLGKTYMLALEDSRSMLEGGSTLLASGRIGERIHQLKEWLNLITFSWRGV